MNLRFSLLLISLLAAAFVACDDDDTYADRIKRERKQIEGFLSSGIQIMDNDSMTYLLDVPGNIKVISESDFYANDSTTDVSKNEYVLFSGSGVYMQIVRKGPGEKLANGETATAICRFIEYNIAADTIQATNDMQGTLIYEDIMVCSNTNGLLSGSFLSGVMKTTYGTATVPSSWLIPLTFVNLGRQTSPEGVAQVRLIVPSSQGQSDASYNIYPCFYEISYQRGR